METRSDQFTAQFARDVDEGLSAKTKFLSSRYFYDAKGDELFQKIMKLPEYYITECEYEIFERQKQEILENIYSGTKFNLLELGAGDGYKTKLLLRHFLDQNIAFEYYPIDISADVLKDLKADLGREFPNLKVTELNYEYFHALEKLNNLDSSPKVILFLGSNIGNFSPDRAVSFFGKLHEIINPGDKLLCGIDLKKNPHTILRAYNDSTGVTRSFNLNLLERINRELGADFKLKNWEHYPTYDPVSGEARSYLMSKIEQQVHIKTTGKTYNFQQSEPVHVEISRKYSISQIEALARNSGFKVKKHFVDHKEYFVDTLWEKQ